MRLALIAGVSLSISLVLSACASETPQRDFVANLSTLCGNTYAGRVVSTDGVDADWRGKEIIVGPVDCEVAGFKMPLAVGEDRSRTWLISPEKNAITLKHDHRHKDGSPDAVTLYGGTTASAGTATRQEFPVDAYSVALFQREGLSASVTNTWALDIEPGQTLAYELSRPRTEAQIAEGAERGRYFRLEFDLSAPLDMPDAATDTTEP